jgi:hypothetical protein
MIDNTMAKRYERGKLESVHRREDEQTTQWSKDTKGVIIIRSPKRRTENTMAKRYQRGN